MNSILSILETAVAEYLMLASMTAAVLVPVAWGLVKMKIVKNSVNRHMVWLFTLLAIVLLPAIWLHGPKLNLAVLPIQNNSEKIVSQPANVDFTSVQMDPTMFRFSLVMTFLVWGWAIGFLLMLIRLAASGISLRGMLRIAEPVHDIFGFEDGGSRGAKLLLSQEVDCPVCFGLLQPVILIPTQMYNDVGPKDLKMILRHEVAHIERRDCWVNLFQRLIEAVLFFHPMVWYASSQLTQQREELCDLHVVADGESTENYVELLTRIARNGFEKRAIQAVALFEGRLLSRVQNLLGVGGAVRVRASRKAAGVFTVAAILCLAAGTVRIEGKSDTAFADNGVSNTLENSYGEEDVPNGTNFSKVYKLKYADAEELAKTLQGLAMDGKDLSGAGKEAVLDSIGIHITADKASNSLSVMVAKSADYSVIEKIIQLLDIPTDLADE